MGRNEIKMENKPMKILIIEDDINDCNKLIESAKLRNDIEIVAVTDSDIDALGYVKVKHPEGIVLDLELNNGRDGNTDSFGFLENLKNLKLSYEPIIIVTTHVNSKRTYEILHRNGVELILYKDHPNYSANQVFNKFISLKRISQKPYISSIDDILKDENQILSDCINHELDLVGITPNFKGRQYLYDAILFLIENKENDKSIIQYLMNKHKKASSTITNGMQIAISHGWKISAVEDLEKYYTNVVNHETGVPTPMELIYYYADKIKKII